jgi:hypothetical protein
MQPEETRARWPFLDMALVFLSLAGVVACLTILYLSMRAVMDVGGMCAEGGPYEIRQECPKGVPLLLVGSIWIGIFLVFVYIWRCTKAGGPNLAGLFWPALFLSLGWNFLQYGFDPPGDEGLVGGWIVCGVVFVVMGGVPLVVAAKAFWNVATGRTPPPDRMRDHVRPRVRVPMPSTAAGAGSTEGPLVAEGSVAAEGEGSAGPAEDLVSALERLAYLHRTGQLDDAEYETAKDAVLGGNEP